jgi:ketosteroid isomerase-like protein
MPRILILLAIGAMPLVPARTTAQLATAEDSVRATLMAFAAATERGDWDAVAAFYDDAPGFRWIERGAITARSRADIRRHLAQVPAGTTFRTTFDSLDLSVAAPSVVVGTARSRTTFHVSGSTAPAGAFEPRLSMVLVRRAAGWKFVQGQATSPPSN